MLMTSLSDVSKLSIDLMIHVESIIFTTINIMLLLPLTPSTIIAARRDETHINLENIRI